MPESLSKLCQRWPLLVFAILSLALYLHTLNYGFVFDDSQNIRDNPCGYRLVNIVIHMVNAGLVYWPLCLIRQLEAAGKEPKFKITRLNENTRDVEAPLHLGNLYFEQQDYDRAATHYMAIVDIDPAFAVAHFNLGVIAIRRDDLARAHTSLSRTLELQPQYANARAEFVTATNRLAVGLLQAAQVPRAFQHCQAGLKTVNDSAVLHNTMGGIYGQQGKLTLAVESFRRDVELDPEFGDAKRNPAAAEKMLQEQ